MAKKHHVIVVFRLDPKEGQFVKDVNALKDAVTTAPGNTRVTIAAGDITQLVSDLADLQSAQAKVDNRTGNAADRDLAWDIVKEYVRKILTAIQTAMDAAPDEETAIAIATDCGCRAKVHGAIVKLETEAKMDKTISGLVHLISKAAKKGVTASYEWQMSTNGINFTTIKTATGSRTTFQTNVAPGTKLYFKKRIILPDKMGGAQAWSQVVFVFVTF